MGNEINIFATRRGTPCVCRVARSMHSGRTPGTRKACLYGNWLLIAQDDIYQATGNVDDFLHRCFADQRGDARVVDGQFTHLGFTDVRRDFDAFAHLAVDLYDQREGFIFRQCLIIGWPLRRVNAVLMTRQVPQLFANMWCHWSQQLYHRFQRPAIDCVPCNAMVLLRRRSNALLSLVSAVLTLPSTQKSLTRLQKRFRKRQTPSRFSALKEPPASNGPINIM